MSEMYDLKLIEIRGNKIDGKFQDFFLISEHVSRIEILEILEKTICRIRLFWDKGEGDYVDRKKDR
jgi:hypothetical protein